MALTLKGSGSATFFPEGELRKTEISSFGMDTGKGEGGFQGA
jgi:hypothetical protein